MSEARALINRHSGTPLYRQVAEHLEREILENLHPGDKLDSESVLAERFNVHRLTLRQALSDLAKQGLVTTFQGKGTYVASPTLRYEISAGREASFTRSMREAGHLVETRLIKVQSDDSPERRQELQTTQAVKRIDIQRLVDGAPWSRTSTWIAEGKFPRLEDHWDGSNSLYEVLNEVYGVRMQRAFRSFASLAADSADAEWLMIPLATPILQVRGLNIDQDGEPVASVAHRYPGDRLEWTMDLR